MVTVRGCLALQRIQIPHRVSRHLGRQIGRIDVPRHVRTGALCDHRPWRAQRQAHDRPRPTALSEGSGLAGRTPVSWSGVCKSLAAHVVGRKLEEIMAMRKRHSPEQVARKQMTADRLLGEGKWPIVHGEISRGRHA